MILVASFCALLSTSDAATAASEDAARRCVADVVSQFNALLVTDLGYCDHEYVEFSRGYRVLIDSPAAAAMDGLATYYQLAEEAPGEVDHNPSETRCLSTLEQAKALFSAHSDYLQTLAATLPPRDVNADD